MREPELAILSALAHGNAPDGMAVVLPALGALARLDPEHEAVYFHLIHDALREPMRAALEKLIMERQTEAEATFPPFAQHLIDRGRREGVLEGKREGVLEGKREGVLEGKRGTLLRLMARRGIALTGEERARIEACTDTATLDQWVDNAIAARTAADVLS